jgi:hypothetical protein
MEAVLAISIALNILLIGGVKILVEKNAHKQKNIDNLRREVEKISDQLDKAFKNIIMDYVNGS